MCDKQCINRSCVCRPHLRQDVQLLPLLLRAVAIYVNFVIIWTDSNHCVCKTTTHIKILINSITRKTGLT